MRSARAWILPHAAIVIGFLAAVASYRAPGAGFTAFLTLPAAAHDEYELPAVRAVPHYSDPTGGYDGQFYAQLALEPLLRDPAIDRALDNPPFRARRILLPWIAYAVGLGDPAHVLDVYALENVGAWLVMAWMLWRWFPPGSPRAFLLWTACLLTHGMLASVRYALVDGPSVVLLGGAVIAVERSRPWLAAAIVGVSGLARETNLLATSVFASVVRRRPRRWGLVAGCLVVAAVPFLLWLDYLRSIYLSSTFTGGGHIVWPFVGLAAKLTEIARAVGRGRWGMDTVGSVCAVAAFVVQAGGVLWAVRRQAEPSPWLPIAVSFALLGVMTHPVVWTGSPGAITRVALPLAVGFNVALREAPWPLLVAGNLTVVPGVWSFLFHA